MSTWESSEGSEARGIFRTTQRARRSQRVLGHRGERTLEGRIQRSCARYLRFEIVGGHKGELTLAGRTQRSPSGGMRTQNPIRNEQLGIVGRVGMGGRI